ncbi:MAG: UDP-N-acetylglucosamine 1-carboxyvinyltransferase [Firmicutes bacterium]|nr:UDP-N-acetylglucosamine 1-carboxyvinyltransferase [Bacillota bacterium]
MDCYHIEGGIPLRGEYRVKGAKNSALPIMAATVCRAGVHELYDCPRIEDVFVMEKILQSLGAKTRWEDCCLVVDSRGVDECAVSRELMMGMRSSVFLLGSLLARCGEATIYRPGGCKIGERPIDMHISGLQQLGIEVEVSGERVTCRGHSVGGTVTLPYPSVGATENLIMAALSGDGDTIIENCAAEPEIADLQGFLRNCGFQVHGAGTDTIFIKGSSSMHCKLPPADTMYFILEDRVEAATYIMAVIGTGGRALFRNIRHELVREVLRPLEHMGAVIKRYDDMLEVVSPRNLKSPGIIITEPYPGFPTDCQPQMLTLCTVAKGLTTIREEIFESRFTHKKELVKMGANIETCGKNAIIKGVSSLSGKTVEALDLRGGAALVLAGLMAEGHTEVRNIGHIDRGYQDFDKGIRELGGLIERRTCD